MARLGKAGWLCHLVVLSAWFGTVAINATQYSPLSYEALVASVQQLAQSHPDRCKLTIAQEEFDLPSPGMCGKDQSLPCTTQILHITNLSTYADEKETRPQVYISGELHGDERVGPHASVELARVLLESDNPWIRFLVNTRSIYITPITNSIGFDRNTREENSVDPNRDYPIDQTAQHCMRAIASRIANELYRNHMFQLAITFHGGMEAIAMEWGTMSRPDPRKHKSPDDAAFMQMAGGLASFSGPVSANGKNYPVGRMNDLVYPVEGGMEDWAYAGNWDPDSTRTPCNPSTYGGYSSSRTQYTDSMLRAVNVLVETSNQKWPTHFGTSENILDPHSGTGHVPRNVRLALMLVDLVQPYVQWTHAEQSPSTHSIDLRWEVGGAFTVDETWAVIEIRTPSGEAVTRMSRKMSGSTRWGTRAYADRSKWPFRTKFTACFKLPQALLPSTADDKLLVEARVFAKVDSAWATTNGRESVNPPGLGPQSHYVNARTNPDWDKTNAGFRVKGKLVYSSKSVTIRVAKDLEHRLLRATNEENRAPSDLRAPMRRWMGVATPEEADKVVNADCVEVSASDGNAHVETDGGDDGTKSEKPSVWKSGSFIFTILALALFISVAGYMYRTRGGSGGRHQVLSGSELDGE